MENQVVSSTFNSLSVPQKIEEAEVIISNFKEQKDQYPTPDVPIGTFELDKNAMADAYKASLNHGVSEKETLSRCEKVVNEDYRKLGLYAERVTNNDREKLLKLGFRVKKGKARKHKEPIKVIAGPNTGSVVVKYHKISGAKTYIYQISTDGITWTQYGLFTTCKTIISNLTVDTRYYFRVAAVTSKGTTDFSSVVSKVVE